MTTVFFTADLHLGHELVAKERTRGWVLPRVVGAEVTAHDRVLAHRWDATVKPDDTVWVLGDLCAGGPTATRRALEWIDARPGVKHLVAGNHDKVHPMHRDAHKWQREYLESGFESVQAFARRRIDGQQVLLSHFPYEGDHTARSRFDQYRLPCEGLPLLHGHTHSSERVTSVLPDGDLHVSTPQVHVGVDAWDLTPVSIDQVAELLTGAS